MLEVLYGLFEMDNLIFIWNAKFLLVALCMPDLLIGGAVMRHALIPLAVLLAALAVGMIWDMDHSARVLLYASFLASIAALISTLAARTFSLNQAVEAWIHPRKSAELWCQWSGAAGPN